MRKTGRLVVSHEAGQRWPRRGDRREHHRPLLRRPQGGARAGDRLRHPVPGGEGRGALPAQPRPDARRRRPRDGQTALPDRMEGVMTTIKTVTLPDLGEGLTESDLVEWVVAVGDTVELNQVVAEVETAKALVQLPSPYAGVVAELLVEPGRDRSRRAALPATRWGPVADGAARRRPTRGRRRRMAVRPRCDEPARRPGGRRRPGRPRRRRRRARDGPSAVLVGYASGRAATRPRRRGRRRTAAARTPSPTTSVSRSRAVGSSRRSASSRTTWAST